MLLSDFDYFLPPELIASEPVEPRDHSRLLVVDRSTGNISHHYFYDLPHFLKSGDCLVRNTSRVISARLPALSLLNQSIEVFLLKNRGEKPQTWDCLVKPGKKIRSEAVLKLKDGTEILVKKTAEGKFEVVFPEKPDFFGWLDTVGEPPLPPYIKRKATLKDYSRYQTVFSKEAGSIAAPTAGLHFTESLIQNLQNKEIHFADILLHVGYGTFAPIRATQIEDHEMHEEFYRIPSEALSLIKETREKKNRVIAVGTTSLRSLESLSLHGPEGNTRLFITPGYEFKQTDGLITNFHLPQSTLLILLCAFLGKELCLKAYQVAVEEKYRFFSYGDAMLVL